MKCNYSNLCGAGSTITGGNNYYVKNGGTAKSGDAPEENNDVYMPYVELKINEDLFVSGDSTDTAINDFDSCNTSNDGQGDQPLNVVTSKSYIQSFEMTAGATSTGTIVIVTCDYSVVERLLDVTVKSTCEWPDYQLGGGVVKGHINIGWIIKDCNGNTKKFTMIEVNNNQSNTYTTEDGNEVASGPYIYGVFTKADVSYENGIYKVTLNFIDSGSITEEYKFDKICFSEEHADTFTNAILQAVKFNCDNRESDLPQTISRIALTRGGAIGNWKFSPNDGGKNGPKSVYNGLRTTLFSFLREISNCLMTTNKKGWWFAYDNGSCGKPSVLLVEDRNPNLCISDNGLDINGQFTTYVVNGGNCSPVIKFTPSFNSVPVKKETEDTAAGPKVSGTKFSIGGGGPSAVDQTPVQLFNCQGERNPDTGKIGLTAGSVRDNKSTNGYWATVTSIAEQLIWRTPVDIVRQTAKAIYAQTITEASDGAGMSIFAPIKATLEIHGDPFWANTINVIHNCFIKVILLNPFCLEKNSSGECEFLQKPKCNSKFSGVYKVGSAKHSINSGSYVTTLELYSIGVDAENILR